MKSSEPHPHPAEASEASPPVTPAVPTPVVYPGLIAPDRVDADAVKVLNRLSRSGYEGYLVGGGVRDLLLRRSPKDFDIATNARPNDLRRLFRNCRIIGRRFRLAHILFAGGKVIEVATFRRDPSQQQGGEPIVSDEEGDGPALWPAQKERSDDTDLLIRHDNTFGLPHEDAIRRDFTINGLFYDLERAEVIDYVGGVRDLREAVVRTIGEPDVRFREDPIRILRAIKFSARLDFGVAPELYDAMVDLREELARAAPPRVLEEILRLMRGGASQRSIYIAWDVGVLGVILPELSAHLEDQVDGAENLWDRLRSIDALQAAGRLPSDTVLVCALLYGPLEEAVLDARDPASAFDDFFGEMVLRLSLPRRMRDRMRLIFAAQRRLDRGQIGPLRRRDFFDEALALLELRCSAEGRSVPQSMYEDTARPEPDRPRRLPARR